MDLKLVNYIQIDENGDRSSDAVITPDNMFYLMGSTWDFVEDDVRAAGYAPVAESIRVFTNGEGHIEIFIGEITKGEDGSFTQQWIVSEIQDHEKQSRFLDRTRLNLLSQSDWTQLPDSPLSEEAKAAWAEYRQALRDMPKGIDWSTISHQDQIVYPLTPGTPDSTPEPDPTPEPA
jgi:hypothetical protein